MRSLNGNLQIGGQITSAFLAQILMGVLMVKGMPKYRMGGVLVVIYANDLNQTLECVVKAGGEISKPTFDFPGGKRFHFCDPNGNELAVWSE